MSFQNLESAIVGSRDKVIALLESLKGEGVDMVKVISRGKEDARRGLLFEYRGFDIVEESPSEDEYELHYRLSFHIRDEDPTKLSIASINLVSRAMVLLYSDRTLASTVIDVKIPSSTDDATGEFVPEDGEGYASKIASVDVDIRVLLETAT